MAMSNTTGQTLPSDSEGTSQVPYNMAINCSSSDLEDKTVESAANIHQIAMFVSGFVVGIVVTSLVVCLLRSKLFLRQSYILKSKGVEPGDKGHEKEKISSAIYDVVSDSPSVNPKRLTISDRARQMTPESTPVLVRKNGVAKWSLRRRVAEQTLTTVPLPSCMYESLPRFRGSDGSDSLQLSVKSMYSQPADSIPTNSSLDDENAYVLNPEGDDGQIQNPSGDSFYFRLEKHNPDKNSLTTMTEMADKQNSDAKRLTDSSVNELEPKGREEPNKEVCEDLDLGESHTAGFVGTKAITLKELDINKPKAEVSDSNIVHGQWTNERDSQTVESMGEFESSEYGEPKKTEDDETDLPKWQMNALHIDKGNSAMDDELTSYSEPSKGDVIGFEKHEDSAIRENSEKSQVGAINGQAKNKIGAVVVNRLFEANSYC